MDWAYWGFLLLWLLALALTFLPFFPATWLLLLAVLVREALLGFRGLGGWEVGVLALLFLLAFFLDNLALLLGAKRYGAGRAGLWGAFLGGVLGLFLGFWGVLLLPLLLAFAFEVLAGKDPPSAFRAALGTLVGLLGGVVVKFLLHLAIGLYVLRAG